MTDLTDLPDLFERGHLLTTRLTPRAHTRYEQALWYAWGREDAGDQSLSGTLSTHYLGDVFGFAEFAALEAERYERQQVCMLHNIADQHRRYREQLGT